MILNASSLIRNRHKDKYFGIDYYANICHGSNPIYNYLATPLDFYPLANEKSPSRCLDRETDLIKHLSLFDSPKIIGFFDNPDVYQCRESLAEIIREIGHANHGLFIQTYSLNILNDIDTLVEFNQSNPLLVGLPISGLEDGELSIFNSQNHFKTVEKIAKALDKASINYGFIIKPVIPFINDDVKDFSILLTKLIELNPAFIYPTFSVTFDSKKLNNFYQLIDRERSELKSKFFDIYGYKKSWMSPLSSQLKRTFIFTIKKTKIAYSMNQIIDLYKKVPHEQQISLF